MSKFEIVQRFFTSVIIEMPQRHFGEDAEDVFFRRAKLLDT